ncbi:MAG: flagellar biosynthesis protein FlhB [Desulfonatronovibrionaceae bacterium]
MPQKDPSRTEKATPKQRRKARQEGNVPRSEEMPKAVTIVAGLIIIRLTFPFISTKLTETCRFFLDKQILMDLNTDTIRSVFVYSIQQMALILLPIMLFVFLACVVCIRAQVGHLWTFKPFKPKISKFNIVSGLGKICNLNSAIKLVRSIFQAAVIAVAPYLVIKSEIHNFLPLFYQSIEGVIVYILELGYKTFLYALVPMIIIAIIDLVYQRWDYEENLKMTKDEIKDERKQAEGDPAMKKEQRQKMFSSMQQRMRKEVPEADVVITNPTHIAVALKYDPSKAPAPLVLAKGADYMAEKIKEIAREHDVPIRENKPLAQALYKSVEIGESIPEEMYKAVAAILAELYKYKKQPG